MFYQVGRDSTTEVIRITRIWKSYQTHLRFISHPRNLTNKWWVFWWVFWWLKWTYGEGQGLDVPNPKDFTQIISTSYKEGWWRRGGFNPLHFRLHPYFTFNPLVLLMMRHQITDWKEVRLWFDNHQTITKSNIITLTKYISKENPHIYASSNLVFLYNAQKYSIRIILCIIL